MEKRQPCPGKAAESICFQSYSNNVLFSFSSVHSIVVCVPAFCSKINLLFVFYLHSSLFLIGVTPMWVNCAWQEQNASESKQSLNLRFPEIFVSLLVRNCQQHEMLVNTSILKWCSLFPNVNLKWVAQYNSYYKFFLLFSLTLSTPFISRLHYTKMLFLFIAKCFIFTAKWSHQISLFQFYIP